MEFYDVEAMEEENKKGKKGLKIVLVLIFLLIIAVIAVVCVMMYMKSNTFKITIDGKNAELSENVYYIDEQTGKVYFNIKQFASYVGYSAHDGEYKIYSQDSNKCYVETTNETASFYLNSNKINKVAPDSKEDYESYTISEPVKNVNGELYVIEDGIEKACNLNITYSKEQNSLTIYTLPYLVEYYNPKIISLGYAGIDTNFNNQKAILYDLFVVSNATDADTDEEKENAKKGVIKVEDGKPKEVIALRYTDIEFSEKTEEFIVKNNYNKMGIMLKTGATKINLSYDDIKVMDADYGLYIVKNENRYGVINDKEQYIIHIEYDDIGIDLQSFPSNKVDNQYMLFDNAIPVKQGTKWGLFNKNGEKILPVEYDSIGCVASTVKDKVVNNLLIIPDIEAIVICKDKKYGLITSTGTELLPTALESIYSITDAGIDDYYMIYSYTEGEGEDAKEQKITYNVIDYLKAMKIINTSDEEINNQNTNSLDNTNTVNNTNTINNANNVNNTNNVNSVNGTENSNNVNQENVVENAENYVVPSQINDIVL